jgi:hypothetical protein
MTDGWSEPETAEPAGMILKDWLTLSEEPFEHEERKKPIMRTYNKTDKFLFIIGIFPVRQNFYLSFRTAKK